MTVIEKPYQMAYERMKELAGSLQSLIENQKDHKPVFGFKQLLFLKILMGS